METKQAMVNYMTLNDGEYQAESTDGGMYVSRESALGTAVVRLRADYAAAPKLVEALRLNWEHTDDRGRTFYCNCPCYDRLSCDCRKDRDEQHSTGCQEARAALHEAGILTALARATGRND